MYTVIGIRKDRFGEFRHDSCTVGDEPAATDIVHQMRDRRDFLTDKNPLYEKIILVLPNGTVKYP